MESSNSLASWGRKGLFSLHFHITVHHHRKLGLELKQVRKQELMQRPWRDVPYWLPSPGLLSLLSYRTQNHQPRDSTTLGPSPWSLIEKMPYSWISWRHFLNWSSFLCDNSSYVKLTHKTSQYNMYVFICVCVYVCVSIYVCPCVYEGLYVCMWLEYVSMSVSIYVCVYICV